MTTTPIIKWPENQFTSWADRARRLTWAANGMRSWTTAGTRCTGGTLNAAHNCLDVHVEEGRGDRPALIFDSPQTAVKDVRLPSAPRGGGLLRRRTRRTGAAEG
ncbi:hypothetical protein [Saccharothrix saharensis]|uniref:hypothetical protein n=1 Tax=Saccharothrix saharensis TaxID=571190 RepID=UPI001478E8A5|nr:hypothetical protein [Saccharothrix saharensis]